MLEFCKNYESVSQELITHLSELVRSEKSSKKVGFYDLPLEFDGLFEKIKKAQEKFTNKKHFVVIGMGGSSLGAKAIASFLDIKNIYFLDNISSLKFDNLCKKINLSETLFFLISKSGNTIESISYFRLILKRFNIGENELKEHFIAICLKNCALANFASKFDITQFCIDENVSGRFSVLSAVGIVPLAFAGCDVAKLIEGAKDCMKRESSHEIAMQQAYQISNNCSSYILFSYCDELRHFNEWFVQLIAESLGKMRLAKRLGITPISLIGPADQHSFLQLIMDGPRDKFVEFICLKADPKGEKIPQIPFIDELESACVNHSLDELQHAQALSCYDAITAAKINASFIEIESKNARDIGYLIYYYELLTAACGRLLDINTYNQPGVESAKILLKMRLNSKKG